MRTQTRALALSLAILLAVGWAGSARALEAELPWHQEDALKLAKEYQGAVEKMLKQASFEQRFGGLSQKSIENYLLVDDLKRLRSYTKILVAHLAKGEGQEETTRLFSRMRRLNRDAMLSKDQSPVLDGAEVEMDRAQRIFDDLAAYYEARPPPVAAPAEKPEDAPAK